MGRSNTPTTAGRKPPIPVAFQRVQLSLPDPSCPATEDLPTLLYTGHAWVFVPWFRPVLEASRDALPPSIAHLQRFHCL